MDKYTIIDAIKQLCEKETIGLLKQYINLENFETIEQLIKMKFETQKTISHLKSEKIIIRDFQYHLIQQNEMSIFSTLEQLETLEETIYIIVQNKEKITKITLHNLNLTLTLIAEIKDNISKIASLQIKQCITTLIKQFACNIHPTTIEFNQLLNAKTQNYRYLLGYELIEETIPELESYSQCCFARGNKIPVSRETRMEKAIYHRNRSINEKYNQIIKQNLNITMIKMLQNLFSKWEQDHSNESGYANVICNLWCENISWCRSLWSETITSQQQNAKKEEQIDGQLDLWAVQKKKSLIPND